MPIKLEIDDEVIDRFLALSAAYFAHDLSARPIEIHVERRRSSRAAGTWPKARERRIHVGNPRQYPGTSLLP